MTPISQAYEILWKLLEQYSKTFADSDLFKGKQNYWIAESSKITCFQRSHSTDEHLEDKIWEGGLSKTTPWVPSLL